MTIQEQMTAAAEFAELWQALMPGTPPPRKEQFVLWAGNYTVTQVTRGINGAARKLRAMRNISQPMASDDVARYASSIMRNESMGVRQFPAARTSARRSQ